MSRVTRSSPRLRTRPSADDEPPDNHAPAAEQQPATYAAVVDAATRSGKKKKKLAAASSSSSSSSSSSRRARSQERGGRLSLSESPPLALQADISSNTGGGNGHHAGINADDDDEDDPATYGRGSFFADAAADMESPVGVIGRTLCCAGGRGSLSWFGMGIICSALALASLGIHLLLELLGDKLDVWIHLISSSLGLGLDTGGGGSVVRALAVLATLLVIVAVPLTHGLVGVRRHGMLSYTFWQPFVGGLRFVLLQVIAWTIWTATVLAGLYGAWVGTKRLTTGWFSAVGVGGVVSQLLVLVSLHFFVSGVSTKQRRKQAAAAVAAAAGTTLQETEQPILQRTRSEGSLPVGGVQQLSPHSWASTSALPSIKRTAMTSTPPTPVPKEEEEAATSAAAAEEEEAAEEASSKAAAAAGSIWPWGSTAMKLTFLVVGMLSLLLALFVESGGAHKRDDGLVSPLLSLFTSAILLAVPITHLLARRSLTHAGYLLFQPFKGGKRFVALQAVAWTLWTLAFCSAGASFVFVLLKKQQGLPVPDAVQDAVDKADAAAAPLHWISSLVTSAGVGGVLSQALVLLSLKYFDSKLSSKIGRQARVIEMVRQASHAAAAVILPEGMATTPAEAAAGTDAGAKVAAQTSPSQHRRSVTPQQAAAAAAAAAVSPAVSSAREEHDVYARASQVLSSPMSHKLLASPHPHLLLADFPSLTPRGVSPRSAAPTPRAGAAAAAAASAADAVAASTVTAVDEAPTLHLPESVVVDRSPTTSIPAIADGSLVQVSLPSVPPSPELPASLASLSLGDLTQSFHLYRHQLSALDLKDWTLNAVADVAALTVVAVFYFVPILGAVLTCAPLVALALHWHQLPWWLYVAYATSVLVYLSTYRNRPSLTGSRSWDAVRHNAMLWSAMERYFHAQIVPSGPLNPTKGPFIFGFHPHGIYPVTCLWATRGPQFRKAFPDVHVDVCGASIMFYAPLLRDICMWSGGREVSGSALRIALKQQRSVLLVPGGQREMRHSVANPLELTLVTRHRGFIRLAIEHGTPLVPVLSIGETMLLENVRAPRMQAYTLRTFGVGFPIWPYGRWYSPLPNRTKILVVFGQPIEVPKQDKPSAQLVEDVHAAYYKQLQHMFEQHKNLVPGFEECKLVYTDD